MYYLQKHLFALQGALHTERVAELSVLAETSDVVQQQLRSMQDDDDFYGDEKAEKKGQAKEIKVLEKKMPRKLPQFMLRPVPTDADGVVQENFRIFVKWALSLIQNNTLLTAPNAPKCVLVNLPQSFDHVFQAMTEEEKENGLPFIRFDGADDDRDLAANLE